jgi:hypothetical protein
LTKRKSSSPPTTRTRRIETAAAMYDDGTDNQYFEQKMRTITDGLQKRYSTLFTKMLTENAIALLDFIINVNTEINLSEKHKMNMMDVLYSLSNHFQNNSKCSLGHG